MFVKNKDLLKKIYEQRLERFQKDYNSCMVTSLD
jgi:hypothetical protein